MHAPTRPGGGMGLIMTLATSGKECLGTELAGWNTGSWCCASQLGWWYTRGCQLKCICVLELGEPEGQVLATSNQRG